MDQALSDMMAFFEKKQNESGEPAISPEDIKNKIIHIGNCSKSVDTMSSRADELISYIKSSNLENDVKDAEDIITAMEQLKNRQDSIYNKVISTDETAMHEKDNDNTISDYETECIQLSNSFAMKLQKLKAIYRKVEQENKIIAENGDVQQKTPSSGNEKPADNDADESEGKGNGEPFDQATLDAVIGDTTSLASGVSDEADIRDELREGITKWFSDNESLGGMSDLARNILNGSDSKNMKAMLSDLKTGNPDMYEKYVQSTKGAYIPIGDMIRNNMQDGYASAIKVLAMIVPDMAKKMNEKMEYSSIKDILSGFCSFVKTASSNSTLRFYSGAVFSIVSYLKANGINPPSVVDAMNIYTSIGSGEADAEEIAKVSLTRAVSGTLARNSFIIEALTENGIDIGIPAVPDTVAPKSAQNAYTMMTGIIYRMHEGDIEPVAKSYVNAYRRLETSNKDFLERIKTLEQSGNESGFYNMLETFRNEKTINLDMRDAELNKKAYKNSESIALWNAIVQCMSGMSEKYGKDYDETLVNEAFDRISSRGYGAYNEDVINGVCEDMFNSKKPVVNDDKNTVSHTSGSGKTGNAYIPFGYGLSKSHVEMGKPYTEVFGMPYINIRHPIFKTIAMKYTESFKRSESRLESKDNPELKKRVKMIKTRADKAEAQLKAEIKKGSLMSHMFSDAKDKTTQVSGEKRDLLTRIDDKLRKVTSVISNGMTTKNILDLIKMAIDGDEIPVSRNTLVVRATPETGYKNNPMISTETNDTFAFISVENPIKPEKNAAVSKKYLKQFYNIINPLDNADEYIACGAFSPSMTDGSGADDMIRAQMLSVSHGLVDAGSVPESAVNLFRRDIMEHDGYPYTYVLVSDDGAGRNSEGIGRQNDTYKITKRLPLGLNWMKTGSSLVAIHVKGNGMDGLFVMEKRDADVLFE